MNALANFTADDPRARIAAEVASRYRCHVSPAVVQIIPRGVSAFAVGEIDILPMRRRMQIQGAAEVASRQRKQRLDDARKAEETLKAREATEVAARASKAETDRLKALGLAKATRARGPFVPTRHWLRLMIDDSRTVEQCAAVLGLTVIGTKRCATDAGLKFPAVKLPAGPRIASCRPVPYAPNPANIARAADAKTFQARILEMAQSGMTVAQIVAETNRDDRAIRRSLNKAGYSSAKGKFGKLDAAATRDAARNARRAKVREMRDAGQSWREIAANVGCGIATVHEDYRVPK